MEVNNIDINIIAQQIIENLENADIGCVYSDVLDVDTDTMSTKLEAEFLSTYFPKGDCEYWLHSTIIEKIIEEVSEKNMMCISVYVNDVGIRNYDDGVHIYIQFEVTINDYNEEVQNDR